MENRSKAIPHLIATDNSSLLLVGHVLYYNPTSSYAKGQAIPQHLYLTTDEEIKEGDWQLHIKQGIVSKGNRTSKNNIYLKKIVATTNPELWSHIRSNPYVPKIPTSFIEQYIKLYNEGNKPRYVWLEVNRYGFVPSEIGTEYIEKKLELTPDGYVIICPVEERMYTRKEVFQILVRYRTSFIILAENSDIEFTSLIPPYQWLEKNYPK